MSDVRWPNHRSEVRNDQEHLCAVAVAVDELRYYMYVVSTLLVDSRVAT